MNGSQKHEDYRARLSSVTGINDELLQFLLHFTGKVVFPKFVKTMMAIVFVNGLKFNLFRIYDLNAQHTLLLRLSKSSWKAQNTVNLVVLMLH